MKNDGTTVALGAAAVLAAIGLAAQRRRGSASGHRWFHGTDAKNLPSILKGGLAGATDQRKRAWLAPLPGRFYMSRNLSSALSYALGADASMLGRELPEGIERFDGRGAVLELSFDTDDRYPDEDWLGEALASEIQELMKRNGRGYPGLGRFRWVDEARGRYALDCLYAVSDRTYDQLMANKPWKLDEMATQARIGKRVIRELARTDAGRDLLRRGAAMATEISVPAESVRLVKVWTFDRRKGAPKISRSGRGFFQVARQERLRQHRQGSADKPTFVVDNPKQGLDLIRHPDIVANFERGLRWKPKHGTAVLVPCAGTKPFPQAPSHKHGYLAAFEGKPVDLWVVSEPLGVVPYEFSREYPNDAYDFPPEHLTGRAHDELAKRVAAWFDRVAGKYGRIVAALPAHHQKLVDKGLGLAKSQHRIERAGVGPCRDEGACSTNTFRATAGDYKRWLGKKAGSKAQAAQQQWRHGCPPDYDQPFFHATTWDRLQSIAEDGLTPGGGQRFGGWYAGHSAGKVFVSQGSHTAFHWWSAVDRIVDAHQELRQQEDLDRVVVVMLRIDMKGIPLAQDRAGCIDEPCAFYTTESVGPERIWFYDGSNNLWRPIDEWDESDPAAAIVRWDLEWDEDEPEWQRQSWITFTVRGPYADPHGPGAFAPPAYQDELVMAGWDEQMESW